MMRRILLLASAMLGLHSSAQAACNNPKNWLESPSEGVKTFIGYEQELHSDFATRMTGDLPGHGPHFDNPYPPPLPAEMLEKPWEGKLSKEIHAISYYEPDGKNNWRICRMEEWGNRGSDPVEHIEVVNQGQNPVLLPWLKTHYMGSATIYRYDAKGRINETFVALSQNNSSNSTGIRQCFRFDDKDRPKLWISATSSNVCPKDDTPDLRDYWRRFKYMDLPDGRVAALWGEQHFGEKDGSWTKHASFHVPFDMSTPDESKWFQGGNARLDSVKGVTQILGGHNIGSKDESLSQTFKIGGDEQPIEYYFPKPVVPISLLENPETIYNYDRRRVGRITTVIKLVEYFPAGQFHVDDRFYTAMGRTLRQEHLDKSGKLRQAINVGHFSRADAPDYGFYDEDLKHAGISRKLTGHELHYRVWNYDDTGKATLVALGWNAKFRPGVTEKIDEAKILFGTPDGKVKWANQEDFFKAFDFDPKARRAYPDERR